MDEHNSSLPKSITDDLDAESFLGFNRFTYETYFGPIYKRQGLEPALIIQFALELPFNVPVPDGSSTTSFWKDGAAATISFYRAKLFYDMIPGLVADPRMKVPEVRSRVEVMLLEAVRPTGAVDRDLLSTAFDNGLGLLNLLLVGYAVETKDWTVHRLSRENLRPAAYYRVIEPRDWSCEEGMLLLHLNIPFDKPLVPERTFAAAIHFGELIKSGANAFILSEELMLRAIRQMNQGFFASAVIDAQLSIETFLWALLRELQRAEGSDEATIERAMIAYEGKGFLRLVKKEFHCRIGGHWDVRNEGTVIGRWYLDAYQLRNKVIHAGYQPQHAETDAGISACHAFRKYVVGLLKVAREPYRDVYKFFDYQPPELSDVAPVPVRAK